MTSNNETVSCQNLLPGNIAKSVTSDGNSALLPANVDRRRPFREISSISSFKISSYVTFSNVEILGEKISVIEVLNRIYRVIVEDIFSSSDSFC